MRSYSLEEKVKMLINQLYVYGLIKAQNIQFNVVMKLKC